MNGHNSFEKVNVEVGKSWKMKNLKGSSLWQKWKKLKMKKIDAWEHNEKKSCWIMKLRLRKKYAKLKKKWEHNEMKKICKWKKSGWDWEKKVIITWKKMRA